jgi:hypothetical protein
MNLVTRLLGLESVPVEHRYNLISLRTTGGFGLGGIAEKYGNCWDSDLGLWQLTLQLTVAAHSIEHLLVGIFYLTEILTEAIFIENALDGVAFVG